MKIKTVKDIETLKGKRVLLRVDFNVPMKDGKIEDDTRIRQSLETINYLKDKGARIILISHMGRPKGQIVESLRLTEVAKHLSKLLRAPVKKMDKVIDNNIKSEIKSMKNGEIIMLENTRFRPEEKECDPAFSKELASLGDIFVNDAFSAAHRKHASTVGIANYLPAYGGFLMEKEISALSPLMEGEPIRPLTMIFGGAKIDTKIGVLKNFIDKADYFLIGGALANTFLSAAGFDVGASLFEKDKVDMAREIMLECEKHRERFIIPHDVVVANEISETANTAHVPVEDVMGDMKILDIGKWTAEKFNNIIEKSGTVIWNGPLGLYEYKPFRNGTKLVAYALARHDCDSIIGGGDTIDALKKVNVPGDNFTHISTGGGACLEFLSGKKLPGIEILRA